ncbi:Ulp1-like peptidase [Cucumis melo var. makuwa]|uniref:Ulp1-like peptidase n=1 Tax=Cucumis melo var. makuwa TaxID=1194695 RepID=A0A5A7U2L7_CUCMM|nr:Ulp1-like peptidase [Cucumis melo var. makuwa]
MITSDQPYVEEQHTEEQHTERQEETQREHQEESGSDISIDSRDANLLLAIRNISDNLNAQNQKEKDLPEMITTLPLVSQPLPLCEMAQLDQTVQIHEVPPSISIVNEESQLETTKQQVEIQKNDTTVTLVEKEPVTEPDEDEQQKLIKRRKLCEIENKKVSDEDQQVNPPTTSTEIISEPTIPVPDVETRDVDRSDNHKAEWTNTTAHLNLWTEEDLEYYFNTAVGDFQDKPGWGDVNYMIGCINIKEY